MNVPWYVPQFSLIEWKFRIKTALLFFASLGTGIFLGAVGCLHYDIIAIIQSLVLCSTYAGDNCTPSEVILTQQDAQSAAIYSRPTSQLTAQTDQPSPWPVGWGASVASFPDSQTQGCTRAPPHGAQSRLHVPHAGPVASGTAEYFFANYHELYSIFVHADPSYTPTTPLRQYSMVVTSPARFDH